MEGNEGKIIEKNINILSYSFLGFKNIFLLLQDAISSTTFLFVSVVPFFKLLYLHPSSAERGPWRQVDTGAPLYDFSILSTIGTVKVYIQVITILKDSILNSQIVHLAECKIVITIDFSSYRDNLTDRHKQPMSLNGDHSKAIPILIPGTCKYYLT